jgi:hypothetical protein
MFLLEKRKRAQVTDESRENGQFSIASILLLVSETFRKKHALQLAKTKSVEGEAKANTFVSYKLPCQIIRRQSGSTLNKISMKE